MHQLRLRALMVVLFFNFYCTYAQDGYTVVTQDFESWNSIGLKFKPNKKFNIGLEQGLRLNHNASIVDQVLTDLSFKWKTTDYLNFGVGLRYIMDRGNNDLFDNDFRFNLDAIFKHDVKALEFKYRLRYQNRNEIGLSIDEGDYFKNYLRLKAEFKYKIKDWKFDPVFSGEIFRDMTQYTGGFDNIRFTLGTSYSLKKFGELDFFYRMERELGVTYPKTTGILGVGYTFTIKNKQ